MRHIIIRNLGPLKNADVYLNKINIIIGPQSSGKSCLLKSASYCVWVEKRIQLLQSPFIFENDNFFERKFIEFHKLSGYTSDKTFLMYESETMKFSYSWTDHHFEFEWKEKRWDFICPKVSYIPAERNMVAAIPNWFEVNMKDDNIRSFMTDWEAARSSLSLNLPILNLGVSYKFDPKSRKDKVLVENGPELDFTNTSSGLQSLIPLLIHLHYIYISRFNATITKSISRTQEENQLLNTIYQQLFVEKGLTRGISGRSHKDEKGHVTISGSFRIEAVQNLLLLFNDEANGTRFRTIFEHFTSREVNDVFLEEPEQNLFPPTQSLLVEELKTFARSRHGNLLFVATHSPYIVTSFIEETGKTDINFFLSRHVADGLCSVCTASEEDLQTIYDYSIDVFHNIDNIV